ncbi:MAG: hypothetical protein ISS29_01340 [Candidatus Marinimicrobia bacterium]|nr:hypothetical protein [Candidatus Neomarinimicrobiota bacterium]
MTLILIIKIILTIFASLLGLSLLILIFPTRLKVNGTFEDDQKQLRAVVSFIYGFLCFFLRWESNTISFSVALLMLRVPVWKKSLAEPVKKPKKKEKKTKEKRDSSELSAIDWISFAGKVAPKIMKPIHFKTIDGDMSVGFKNPAATGFFLSTYYMFRYTTKYLKRINIRANFTKPGIWGKIEIDGLIHLYKYIPILIFAHKNYKRRIREKKGGL